MKPYYDDGRVRLLHGDAGAVLRELAPGSVQTCITSPPYFGLRDYGCGEDEVGREATPAAYVARLVGVMREVRRVLADDGTLWLNLGDSYAGSWGNQGRTAERGTQRPVNGPMLPSVQDGRDPALAHNTGALPPGLKAKDLIGIPWRVAFALQDDGWYLRSDIIWHKPNPMPSSVTDRPTPAHEYLFLLTKRATYYYDADAILERTSADSDFNRPRPSAPMPSSFGQHRSRLGNGSVGNPEGRNKRSVWTIPTHPYAGAHFATFPEKLVEPCLLAGTSERGQCPACGEPWRRVTERTPMVIRRTGWGQQAGNRTASSGTVLAPAVARTLGWAPSCPCSEAAAHAPVQQVVLDPFCGSGTVGAVARRHGRGFVGIDLNPEYLELAAGRVAQRSLWDAG